MDEKSHEEFKNYMQIVNIMKNMTKNDEQMKNSMEQHIGRAMLRHITLEKVHVCTDEIVVNDLKDLEIKPGRYKIKNCDNYISVQYDSLLKGDDLYEAWNLCDAKEEADRYLKPDDVKNMIEDVFRRNN